MKASTPYSDFKGTADADISNSLGKKGYNGMDRLAEFFKLDTVRFKLVGLSIYGTDEFSISLICVDKEKSSEEKDYLVKMMCETENDKHILSKIFENLNIVVHNRFDKKFSDIESAKEVRYGDFH